VCKSEVVSSELAICKMIKYKISVNSGAMNNRDNIPKNRADCSKFSFESEAFSP
jgi:hypothetical protein